MTGGALLEARWRSSGADERQPEAPLRRPEGLDGEPLTPELALVDPELARRAREQLREPLEPRRVVAELQGPPPAAPLPATKSTAAPSAQEAKPARRRSRRRPILRGVFLVAAVSLAVLGVEPIKDLLRKSPEPTLSPAARQSAAPAPAAKTPAAQPPAQRPVQAQKQAPRPTQPSVKRKRRAAPPPVAASQRAFAWVPVPKATSYLVQFYRGRREIFAARPAEARLLLPREWSFKGRRYTLAPGRYSWSVRPGFGRPSPARYGRPIVAAELVVPAASVG